MVGTASRYNCLVVDQPYHIGDMSRVAIILSTFGASFDAGKPKQFDQAEIVSGSNETLFEVDTQVIDIIQLRVFRENALDFRWDQKESKIWNNAYFCSAVSKKLRLQILGLISDPLLVRRQHH